MKKSMKIEEQGYVRHVFLVETFSLCLRVTLTVLGHTHTQLHKADWSALATAAE